MRPALVAALLLAVAGCSKPLPEPESPGARTYQARCTGCHRLHQPGSMTPMMWDQQLERMRLLYAQRGIPWFTPAEEATVRAWIDKYAYRP